MKTNKGIMWELEQSLEEVKTILPHKGYKYEVKNILLVTICGLLCGQTTMKMIHKWFVSERVFEFFRKNFDFPPFKPCYSQFTVVLGNIDAKSIGEVMYSWTKKLAGDLADKTIAIDGKTIRSTANQRHRENPLHIATAYVSELGLTLAQQEVEGKTNEIKAVQELLETLDVKDSIVVADALNCQKKTAKIIDKKGGTYLLSVKKNQSNTFFDVKAYFELEPEKFKKKVLTEKNRGRFETREAYVLTDFELAESLKKWCNIQAIGVVKTRFEENGKTTENIHYYISNSLLTPKNLLKHARLEWGIEAMHWLLDVHFNEDRCSVLNENTQITLNLMRKIVLNCLKKHKADNSIKQPLTMIMADNLFDCNNLLAFFSLSFLRLLLHFRF